jgi:hypothetical protein
VRRGFVMLHVDKQSEPNCLEGSPLSRERPVRVMTR